MIRQATTGDIPRMLELGRVMHAESRYSVHAWNDAKVHALIVQLIESEDGLALVAEHDGEIVGGFIGYVGEHYFTDVLVASDYALFVGMSHRGAMAGKRLIGAYVEWAKSRGAAMIQIGITTGVAVDASSRLVESCGFRNVGNLFEMEKAA